MANKIEICLGNGYKLVAEQNTDPAHDREIFIGVADENDNWVQDLALVRNSYHYDANLDTVWEDDKFDVMVWGDANDEDYTDGCTIELWKGGV